MLSDVSKQKSTTVLDPVQRSVVRCTVSRKFLTFSRENEKKLGEIKAILIRQIANTGLNSALHFSVFKYFAESKPKSVAEYVFFSISEVSVQCFNYATIHFLPLGNITSTFCRY